MATWLIAFYFVGGLMVMLDGFKSTTPTSFKSVMARMLTAVFWPLILAVAAVVWAGIWIIGMFANKWWFDLAVIITVFSGLLFFTLF